MFERLVVIPVSSGLQDAHVNNIELRSWTAVAVLFTFCVFYWRGDFLGRALWRLSSLTVIRARYGLFSVLLKHYYE
jgi:hypothetical protein